MNVEQTDLDTVLSEFKEYLEWLAKERVTDAPSSPLTIRIYYRYIRDFLNFVGKIKFVPYDIKRFFDHKEEKLNEQLSPYTKNVIISAILNFIRFMDANGHPYFKQLNDEIKRGKYKEFFGMREVYAKTGTRALSIDEVKKMLKIFDDTPELRSGVVLLFWFGWREGEATEKLYLALKGIRGYIDFKNKKFKIENEKWRKSEHRFRVLCWCDEIHEDIRQWCDFLEKKKEKLKEDNFRRILDKAFYNRRYTIRNVLGINRNLKISPKTARYTVQTHLMKVIDLPFVSYWLGHKTIFNQMSMLPSVQSTMWTVYRDEEDICEHLRKVLVDEKRHYMFKVL